MNELQEHNSVVMSNDSNLKSISFYLKKGGNEISHISYNIPVPNVNITTKNGVTFILSLFYTYPEIETLFHFRYKYDSHAFVLFILKFF